MRVQTFRGDPPGMLSVDRLQYFMGLLHRISSVSFLFGPGFPLVFILCNRLQKWEASPDFFFFFGCVGFLLLREGFL